MLLSKLKLMNKPDIFLMVQKFPTNCSAKEVVATLGGFEMKSQLFSRARADHAAVRLYYM